MATKTIDGLLFKNLVINGAINLKNNYKEVDKLNVFPVPDGDTGTNMYMTIFSGVKTLRDSSSTNLMEIAKLFSKALLMGARGNSGVILSQYFKGIQVEIERIGKDVINLTEFIQALVSGWQYSYRAVVEPVEGTILTVIRKAAEKVLQQRKKLETLEDVYDVYLQQARTTLDKTPSLLPILKEAGVVDSGGAGFVKIVEGMRELLLGHTLVENIDTSEYINQEMTFTNLSDKEIKYSFCTEFIIKLFDKDNLESPKKIKDFLTRIGDSLVLVTDEEILKVHVHTNIPGVVISFAQKHGELQTIKIENMKLQHSKLVEKETSKEVKPILVDTSLSKKGDKQKYAILAVAIGEGIKKTFLEMGVTKVIDGGQSMNPPVSSFTEAIESLDAENIIVLPNNSNIILTAEQTAKLVENKNIIVIKTKNIAQGYATVITFDPTVEPEENELIMNNTAKTNLYGELTFSIRDTVVNGLAIKINDFIGLSRGEIVVSNPSRVKCLIDLIKTMDIYNKEILTLFYGTDVESKELKEIEKQLLEINPDLKVELVEGNQTVYSYIFSVE